MGPKGLRDVLMKGRCFMGEMSELRAIEYDLENEM